MLAAFKGAYAVFAVTNYWETMDAKAEIQQGKTLADAALESGVQHFIWSSLPNVTEGSSPSHPAPSLAYLVTSIYRSAY
jgi:hypothetical protein